MNCNKVLLAGHLGGPVELHYSPSGKPVCNFRVATDRRSRGEQSETDWHRVVAFDRTAENCARYLDKGHAVFVDGRLQHRKWQDKQGNDRWTAEVIAWQVTFLARPGGVRGSGAQGASDAAHTAASDPSPAPPAATPTPNPAPDDAGRGDDLPF